MSSHIKHYHEDIFAVHHFLFPLTQASSRKKGKISHETFNINIHIYSMYTFFSALKECEIVCGFKQICILLS